MIPVRLGILIMHRKDEGSAPAPYFNLAITPHVSLYVIAAKQGLPKSWIRV